MSMMYDVVMCNYSFECPLQKVCGMPLTIFEYHSVSFSTIGPFNDILGLSGTLNGNLKYHSIPVNKESGMGTVVPFLI